MCFVHRIVMTKGWQTLEYFADRLWHNNISIINTDSIVVDFYGRISSLPYLQHLSF